MEKTALMSDKPVKEGFIPLGFGPVEEKPSASISSATEGDNSNISSGEEVKFCFLSSLEADASARTERASDEPMLFLIRDPCSRREEGENREGEKSDGML